MRPVRFQTLVSAIGFTLLLPAVAPVAGFQSPRDPARIPAASTDRIPAAELAALVARDAVVIVDVREPELFRRGHLPKALLAPPERWRDVALELKSLPISRGDLLQLPAGGEQPARGDKVS